MNNEFEGLVCPECGSKEVEYTPAPEHGEKEYGFICKACGKFSWYLEKEKKDWWTNLDEQTQKIRVEINELNDLAMGGWLKIFLITCILFTSAIFLSFLQPTFVADKIATLWVVIGIFEVGILGGYAMSESIRENTYKAYAEKERK